ncbi:MAG: hypothetical protein R3B72_19630 [Polyangiaceae bacterium]
MMPRLFSLLFLLGLFGCVVDMADGDADADEPSGPTDPLAAYADTVTNGFHPVEPFRAVDTRTSTIVPDDGAICVKVTKKGVPTTATAVAINVTAAASTAPGFLTVYPGGAELPPTSTLNYEQGGAVANGALAEVGDGGLICVHAKAATHVIVDVLGYFANPQAFTPVAPRRKLDTRDPEHSGIGGTGKLGAKTERCVAIADDVVPTGARAVAINLTAVAPEAPGFLVAYPDGDDPPDTSTLNYAPGHPVANNAIVELEQGRLCVHSLAASHVIVDVVGFFGPSSTYRPVVAKRRLDTRNLAAQPRAGAIRCLRVAGVAGVPDTARAVFLNLTAVKEQAPGYLVAFAEGTPIPQTSNLNYAPSRVVANGQVVAVGRDGNVCILTHAATDYVVDVAGYFAGDAVAKPTTFGWDYNLEQRCARTPSASLPNAFQSGPDCQPSSHNWTLSNQSESALQDSCTGIHGQSLPINAGGPLTFAWANHQDETGRPNFTAILKTDVQTKSHPCGAGQYSWFAFMDQRYLGGGTFPKPGHVVQTASIWYDDWVTNGDSRLIAMWSGEWDGRGVMLEINLQDANWGDQYPSDPILVQKLDYDGPGAPFQWVLLDGTAMGLGVPRKTETPITLHWDDLIEEVITRGYLAGPASGNLDDGITVGLSLATELRNGSTNGAVSAELRISDFRVMEKR